MQSHTRRRKVNTAKDNRIERRYANVKDFAVHVGGEIQTLVFRCNSPRCDDLFRDVKYADSDKFRFDNRANRHFLARLYKSNRRTSQVAIIFNGLDETVHALSEDVLYSFYDELGLDLASHGIRAIFLPTPYHMNRVMAYCDAAEERRRRKADGDTYVDYTIPTKALIEKPHNIYRNHFQGFKETIALCRCLRPADGSEVFSHLGDANTIVSDQVAASLRDELDSPCQITLIGYSLGGLRAITEFIHDRLDAHENSREPLFSACVAINSGGALSDLPAPPWVDRDGWKKMISDLSVSPQGPERFKGIPEDEREVAEKHFRILEDVFLGRAESFKQIDRDDERFAAEMLFILGGGDNLVQPDSLNRFGPEGGINLFQVARKGHMFRYRAWGAWQRTTFGLISEFIDATCGARFQRMDPNRLTRLVALLDHALQILPYEKNLGKSGVFDAAVTKIKRHSSLVEAVFGPDDPLCLAQRVGDETAAQLTASFTEYAANLIRVLDIRVRENRCDPEAYKKTRRKLLFGYFVLSDPGLVDELRYEIAKQKDKRVGDILRASGIIPDHRIDNAEQAQQVALDEIRSELRQDYLMELQRGDSFVNVSL